MWEEVFYVTFMQKQRKKKNLKSILTLTARDVKELHFDVSTLSTCTTVISLSKFLTSVLD